MRTFIGAGLATGLPHCAPEGVCSASFYLVYIRFDASLGPKVAAKLLNMPANSRFWVAAICRRFPEMKEILGLQFSARRFRPITLLNVKLPHLPEGHALVKHHVLAAGSSRVGENVFARLRRV